jgi:lysylphosphatidylglycerol synthetase-like protein (DUF2156 family)
MKYIMGQIYTIIGAAACVFAYLIAAIMDARDLTAIGLFILIPALATGVISYRYGFQAITLPLYATIAFLVLARTHVCPFYSSDVGWGLPTSIFSVYTGLSSVTTAIAFAGIRAFWKYRKMPNQAL